MRSAMEELCGLYRDLKTLIQALELPTGDGKDKWMELYLDHSAKLQDICSSFTSRIRELEECHLHLRRALQHLSGTILNAFISVCSSLDKWKQHQSSTLGRCFTVLDGLSSTFDLPKVKNLGKEKVMMQAMHGVKVVTLFVCSVFAASILRDLQVPDTYLWAKAFVSLQTCVNVEMGRMFSSEKIIRFKELEDVDAGVNKLYPFVREGVDRIEADVLASLTCEIRKSSEVYSRGLFLLSKEIDNLSEVLMSGRKALIGDLNS